MGDITITLPESILIPTGQSREGFVQEAKFLLASKLYELGRLSSGRAAAVCGLDRVTFLLSLHRVGAGPASPRRRACRRGLMFARWRRRFLPCS